MACQLEWVLVAGNFKHLHFGRSIGSPRAKKRRSKSWVNNHIAESEEGIPRAQTCCERHPRAVGDQKDSPREGVTDKNPPRETPKMTV